MNAHLVIDLMYGDGGKGITTDKLANTLKKPIVVRFNGGQNAGHTVILADGTRHVFSQAGSGTFRGVPTYWSKYCTFHVIGFVTEYDELMPKLSGVSPEVYLDGLAMVTTPYDALYNRAQEKSRHAHGSMGVGFGATIERNLTPYKFHVQDLFIRSVAEQKLQAVFNYYQNKVEASGNKDLKFYWDKWDFDSAKTKFFDAVDAIIQRMPTVHVVSEASFWGHRGKIHQYENIIFEGSQGIMLDMDFGFFPNVSRSNCTSKNALELFTRYFPLAEDHHVKKSPAHKIAIHYVTRAYQTRHGNGYMTNERKQDEVSLPFNVRENPIETNTYGDWQGAFRRAELDFDMLNYSLSADSNFSGDSRIEKNLVVICLDQVDGYIRATKAGRRLEVAPAHMEYFLTHLNTKFKNLWLSSNHCSDTMQCRPVWNLDGKIELGENICYYETPELNELLN